MDGVSSDGANKRTSPARFAVNAASSLLTRILQIFTLVWANQYLIRRVEPEEYAIFAVVSVMLVVVDLFKLIFTGGLTRYMVEADAGDDPEMMPRIVSSMTPALAFCACVIGLMGAVAIANIESLIKVSPAYVADAQLMLSMLVGLTCFAVLTTPWSAGLFVRQQFVKLNLIKLGAEGLRVTLLAALLIGVSAKAVWLVIASVTAEVASILIQIAFTWRLLPTARFRPRLFSLETAVRLMRFGAWTTVNGLERVIGQMLPILILNRFGAPVDTSAFHLGRLPDQKIRDLLSAAAAPIKPALTSIFAREGVAAIETFYYRGGRYYMWGAMFLAPPFLAFGEPLVALYAESDAYGDAAFVFTALLGIYPLLWANAMFYQVAFAIGRIGAFNVCSVLMQVFTALLLFYFVAYLKMGAIGAAISIAASQSIFNVAVMWPMGLKLVNGRWGPFFRLSVLPGTAPFFVALPALYAYGAVVDVSNWGAFLGGCLLSAAVYLGVLTAFCLDDVDRRLGGRLVGKIQAKAGPLLRRRADA